MTQAANRTIRSVGVEYSQSREFVGVGRLKFGQFPMAEYTRDNRVFQFHQFQLFLARGYRPFVGTLQLFLGTYPEDVV
jgi:hypothetical protein